jgi:hypothetical protein
VSWTWQEIESEWLGGGVLADSPEVVVDAFSLASETFGREWVVDSRAQAFGDIRTSRTPGDGGDIRAISATLAVVTVGKLLSVVKSLPGSAPLVAKLRERRADARAEAMALYLLLRDQAGVEAEVEPQVAVGSRTRKPDARVREPSAGWTYVETAQPESSEAHKRVLAKIQRLVARAAEPTLVPYAVEVVLRREPDEEELEEVARRITAISRSAQLRQKLELPDGLGTMFLNFMEPMRIVIEDHGEEPGPQLGVAQGAGGGDQWPRHVMARVPFSDERADEFLRSKARQLPKDAPGLIMIGTSDATGAIKTWETTLRRRLQPAQYTRVSAICLFQSGQEHTDVGETIVPRTKLIINPHARVPLPAWIGRSLMRYETADFDDSKSAGTPPTP